MQNQPCCNKSWNYYVISWICLVASILFIIEFSKTKCKPNEKCKLSALFYSGFAIQTICLFIGIGLSVKYKNKKMIGFTVISLLSFVWNSVVLGFFLTKKTDLNTALVPVSVVQAVCFLMFPISTDR